LKGLRRRQMIVDKEKLPVNSEEDRRTFVHGYLLAYVSALLIGIRLTIEALRKISLDDQVHLP
jgi:hypothetical protein